MEDPSCQYCPADTAQLATEVDHKTPINKGGDPWDWDNLASACKPCHSAKTRHIDVLGKDRVPQRGCDSDGWPNDPGHHWKG